MNKDDLKGKRYANLVRCSTTEQTETSIPDQLKLLNDFAAEHGMIHVADADIVLPGITGSMPGVRTDIDSLIERKRNKDDVDILLVQDLSRFTRSGTEHGIWLERKLRAEGIDVTFVADHLPEGDHQGVIKSVMYYAARQHAKAIAFSTTRGGMSALLDGRRGYSSIAPFGIDKLYLAPDGTELHIIRDLSDGTQQMLDPKTKGLIQRFGRKERNGSSPHYRKQGQERIAWIAGAEDRVRIVNQFFRRKEIDGWGASRIVRELNAQGSRSASGKSWCAAAIQNILDNPTYIGRLIANQRSKSIYFKRSPSAPTAVKVDERELDKLKHPRVRLRPSEEWVIVEEPRLANFLDADIRELARARILKRLKRPRRVCVKGNKDRHIDSPFILKGVLRSKQGNYPMTGRSAKDWNGKPSRWYAISQGISVRTDDRTLGRHIPAESLENEVLEIVREVMLEAPTLRDKIRREVERYQKSAAANGDEITKLKAEQEKLGQQLGFIIDELGTLGREAAKKKIEQLESQLAIINDRLANTTAAAGRGHVDAGKAANAIIEQLNQSVQILRDAPPATLRRLLAILIPRMEADLPTRDVEFDLALPTWAAMDAQAYENAIRFDTKPFYWPAMEATAPALSLGSYICTTPRRPVCYECRRKRAA